MNMRWDILGLLTIIGIALTFGPDATGAQSGNIDNRMRASKMYDIAMERYRDGKWRQAGDMFVLANEIIPDNNSLQSAALSYLRAHEYSSAAYYALRRISHLTTPAVPVPPLICQPRPECAVPKLNMSDFDDTR